MKEKRFTRVKNFEALKNFISPQHSQSISKVSLLLDKIDNRLGSLVLKQNIEIQACGKGALESDIGQRVKVEGQGAMNFKIEEKRQKISVRSFKKEKLTGKILSGLPSFLAWGLGVLQMLGMIDRG